MQCHTCNFDIVYSFFMLLELLHAPVSSVRRCPSRCNILHLLSFDWGLSPAIVGIRSSSRIGTSPNGSSWSMMSEISVGGIDLKTAWTSLWGDRDVNCHLDRLPEARLDCIQRRRRSTKLMRRRVGMLRVRIRATLTMWKIRAVVTSFRGRSTIRAKILKGGG